MSDCAVDGRPSDSAFLCRGCLDALKAELRSLLPRWEVRNGKRVLVAGLVGDLEITLTRQARVGQRNGPRSSETPLPFHLRASVDIETLRDGLGMWAATVAERRGVTLDAGPSPVALAAWLLRWAGEVAQHPDAAELHGDVLAMTEAARRTIDLPPQKHFVGPCDDCGEDLYCGPAAKVVTCRTPDCGAEYPVEERRVWLLEAAVDQLRTAAELSRELPWIGGVVVDRKRINQWASRGQITVYLPHAKDPRGYPRFRVGEIIDKARQHAQESALPRRVAG